MGYIALRRMQTSEGWREAGDSVPEAADWKHLRAYLGSHLKEVPDAEVPKAPKAAKPKAEKKQPAVAKKPRTPRKAKPKAETPPTEPVAADGEGADGDWTPDLG